jgi:hypothetical protein
VPPPSRVAVTGEKPRSRLGRIPVISVCRSCPASTRAPLVAMPGGVRSDQRPPGLASMNSCQNWFGPDGAPIGTVAQAVPAEVSEVASESGTDAGGCGPAGRAALLPQPAASMARAGRAAARGALVMPTAGSGWPRRRARRRRTTS